MPLCYGGGIKTVEHYKKIISLGVEKIAISSAAVENPSLISAASKIVGSQSVVVVLDIKKKKVFNKYEIFINNGLVKTSLEVSKFTKEIEKLGAGEIVINSIDRDGTMSGYDHNLVKIIRESVSLPITILGGASSLSDMHSIINQFGILGISAGSLFVFKGKYRAVLINFPNPKEKDDLFTSKLGE
jgi:Imidazoleglycerol-phosphate synthase